MNKKIILTALILGILSIILGAFGAHALKEILTDNQLASFETAVKYQMYHTLFLLLIGSTSFIKESAKKSIYLLILFGILLFSGSIYLLTVGPNFGIDIKKFGFITPIGGLLLIIGWIRCLFGIDSKRITN